MDGVPAVGPSFAEGGPIALLPGTSDTLIGRIGDRARANPKGIIRSYRDDGGHVACNLASLWRRAGDVAAALAAAGAQPSDFVVVLTDDVIDFVPAFWGCLRAGAAPVVLMGAAKDAATRGDGAFGEALDVLVKPFVLMDAYFGGLAALAPLLSPGKSIDLSSVLPAETPWVDRAGDRDLAYLVATSGSTGKLKLVALSEQAVLFRNFARLPAVTGGGVGAFPLDGITGLNLAFLHSVEFTHIAAKTLLRRPAAILDAIEEFQCATVMLTSSMVGNIVAEEARSGRTRRLDSLRRIGLGGEPVSGPLIQEFARLVARHGVDPKAIVAGYGTSETGSLLTGSSSMLTSLPGEPVCLGKPLPGVSLRIVGEDGNVLPAGETGEVEVLCPAKMFSAYWGDAALTAHAFTPDGWWRSRDRGWLIDGELTLRGRSRDVLIRNARKLSLAEVDGAVQDALGASSIALSCIVPSQDGAVEQLAIGFDTRGSMTDADAADAIRIAVVRRFGIQPDVVLPIAVENIPRTGNGKVKRAALAGLLAEQAGEQPPAAAPDGDRDTDDALRSRLAAIWSDVLALRRPVRDDDHFFALGGDSLRGVTLHLQIAEAFGVHVTSEEFYGDPTFRSLLSLIGRHRAIVKDAAPQSDVAWPLPVGLRHRLLGALDHWRGDRATRDGILLGFNAGGRLPPIFWVFNDMNEPVNLARALGPEQPLYAMRSGRDVSRYGEDDIQSFALRYVSDIVEACPSGPVFVGGNCQGGIIALAIAQHLARRRRRVPLLVLMDWSFPLHAYSGRVLLVSGAENANLNPRLLFARPELAWQRAFAEAEFAEIPGGYAQGFEPGNVESLVATLTAKMQAAISAPPILMPASGYDAAIGATGLPSAMTAGQRATVAVTVRNDSDVAWGPTPLSGIALASRWIAPTGRIVRKHQPSADLPGLRPDETAEIALEIVAPDLAGDLMLALDLCEEGNRWFHPKPADAFRMPIRVTGKGAWSRLRRYMGKPPA